MDSGRFSFSFVGYEGGGASLPLHPLKGREEIRTFLSEPLFFKNFPRGIDKPGIKCYTTLTLCAAQDFRENGKRRADGNAFAHIHSTN